MITEKDIKRLRFVTSKHHVFEIKYVMPMMALIIFAVALLNIHLAIRFANRGNTPLFDIVNIDLNKQYSGWCMASLNRICLSVFLITASSPVMMFSLFGIAVIRFYKRMLDFIDLHTNKST
ncbi:MAG: hypothetical protein P8Z79_19900 [Sedimentisphaerales bacterium]|jgi:hypothetical protein